MDWLLVRKPKAKSYSNLFPSYVTRGRVSRRGGGQHKVNYVPGYFISKKGIINPSCTSCTLFHCGSLLFHSQALSHEEFNVNLGVWKACFPKWTTARNTWAQFQLCYRCEFVVPWSPFHFHRPALKKLGRYQDIIEYRNTNLEMIVLSDLFGFNRNIDISRCIAISIKYRNIAMYFLADTSCNLRGSE